MLAAAHMDAEIIQDFLLEAGEILDQLDQRLVALERDPGSRDLLNAVFRGFHTIKGGAGFLGLDSLVAVSHKSEDIFDLLRSGHLPVDADLMDTFLEVMDALRRMFDELRTGRPPLAAPASLMTRLDVHAAAAQASAARDALFDSTATGTDPKARVAASVPGTTAAADLITEDEFERLLDRRDLAQAAHAPATGADLISDDEFEAVLDKLHGPGRFTPGLPGGNGEPVADLVADVSAVRTVEQGSGLLPPPRDTVRVETATLDRIMNMVGELVLIRNRLSNLQSVHQDEAMSATVASLDVVTSDLQMAAMKTRMQPIRKLFGRFPRLVRDLARTLDKEIALELTGEDTELDKTLVEALADPLIHLVRNAIDHGIELPAARLACGKRAHGTLRLSAAQAGDQVHLVIEDDGQGIDAGTLRAKAVSSGLLDPHAAERLSERECFELIFLPGFSTRHAISDISGRGVGMDVVKTRIAELNGTITIASERGIGTSVNINLPLTLAIMPTLMVVLGSQVFALPLVNVQEILNFEAQQAREVDGRQALVVRGHAIPLFYLSRWLVRGGHALTRPSGHVVVARIGNRSVGLLVDELIGQEEVLIKPLGALLHGTRGLAGATITGNGRIALILDLPGLLEAYAQR